MAKRTGISLRGLFLLCSFAANSILPASAHFCLISPPQRSSGDAPFSIAQAGEGDCYRRTPYCGGVQPGVPTVSYLAGSLASITFQQNLNHWYNPNPGFMDVAISAGEDPADDDFVILARVTDFWGVEMVQQNNFTVQVQMPESASPHSVIRVRYVSHAPTEVDPANNTEAIFYNCADIEILPRPPLSPTVPAVVEIPEQKTHDVSSSGFDCSAPESFSAEFEEKTLSGTVTHSVWWDGVNQRTRWNMLGHVHGPTYENTTTFNDFNLTRNPKQDEFQIRDDGYCYRYGHGYFYSFVYGSERHQDFIGNNSGVLSWSTGDPANGKEYYAKLRADGKCIPDGWAHGHSIAKLVSFHEVKHFDPSVFVPFTLESTNAAKNGHRGCSK